MSGYGKLLIGSTFGGQGAGTLACGSLSSGDFEDLVFGGVAAVFDDEARGSSRPRPVAHIHPPENLDFGG